MASGSFLKARDGEYDAIVTMYHDQGQSAINNLPAGDYTGNGEDVLLVNQLSNTNAVFQRDRSTKLARPTNGEPKRLSNLTVKFFQSPNSNIRS